MTNVALSVAVRLHRRVRSSPSRSRRTGVAASSENRTRKRTPQLTTGTPQWEQGPSHHPDGEVIVAASGGTGSGSRLQRAQLLREMLRLIRSVGLVVRARCIDRSRDAPASAARCSAASAYHSGLHTPRINNPAMVSPEKQGAQLTQLDQRLSHPRGQVLFAALFDRVISDLVRGAGSRRFPLWPIRWIRPTRCTRQESPGGEAEAFGATAVGAGDCRCARRGVVARASRAQGAGAQAQPLFAPVGRRQAGPPS